MTEGGIVRWHHQLNGHEFVQTLGVGDGQGGLACCSPWGTHIVNSSLDIVLHDTLCSRTFPLRTINRSCIGTMGSQSVGHD